jgi:sodium-dependent dicarboxylate transporter 2/3/5
LLLGILVFSICEDDAVNAAVGILIFAVSLWISERIILSLTALLIPLLAVLLNVVIAKVAFSEFLNPVISLFMGGFVLASALSCHSLDRLLAHS